MLLLGFCLVTAGIKAVFSLVKDLLYNIIRIARSNGIVGNEDSILVLLNKIGLRGVSNSDPVSSNLIVSGYTGMGKDFIVGTLCKLLLPKDLYVHRIHLTEKVFIYWSMNWKGKVLHFEDPAFGLLNSPIFKTIASGGRKATVVKHQDAVDIEINGKPVMIVTSMNVFVGVEGVRRWDMLRLEYSKELSKAVLKSIAENDSFRRLSDSDSKFLKCFTDLAPVSVSIPFRNNLASVLPNNLLAMTLFRKFLDYIRSSAVLHGRVVANWFDYEYARLCFWKLNSLGSVPLNAVEKEFVDVLRESSYPLKISEILDRFTHSESWIRRHKDRLKELGVVNITYEFDEDSNKEVEKLSSNMPKSFRLPSSKEILGTEAYNKDAKAFFCLLDRLDIDRVEIGLKPVFESFVMT